MENDNYERGGCDNCGNRSYVVDWQRGSMACANCGCVMEDHLRVGGDGYRATHDANGNKDFGALGYEATLVGAYVEDVDDYLAAERQTYRNNSPPYRRETYWAERISQWREQEPSIDAADVEAIEDEFWRLTNPHITPVEEQHASFRNLEWRWTVDLQYRYCFHRGTRSRYVVSKDDCRVILWSIDKRRIAEGGKPLFVKKYLVSAFCFLICFCSSSNSLMCCISCAVHGIHGGLCKHSTP